MEILPSDAKKIEVEGATVDFFTFIQDGIEYYYFDTSLYGPPEPMINAMVGLQLINNTDKKLIMINHQAPNGLFTKVDMNFDFDISQLEDNVKIVFSHKIGSAAQTDFTQNSCGG